MYICTHTHICIVIYIHIPPPPPPLLLLYSPGVHGSDESDPSCSEEQNEGEIANRCAVSPYPTPPTPQ